MSNRAAWRLESLGFTQVYRYTAGKRDWFAFGFAMAARLRKFKYQHRPAAGHGAGNEASQTFRGGPRIEQAIPYKGDELLKLCFGQDDGSR